METCQIPSFKPFEGWKDQVPVAEAWVFPEIVCVPCVNTRLIQALASAVPVIVGWLAEVIPSMALAPVSGLKEATSGAFGALVSCVMIRPPEVFELFPAASID